MNVLFFARLFYPNIGGVEKHVLKVSRLLIKKGHNVVVVTEQNSSKLKLQEVVDGMQVFRIPKHGDGKLKKFKIWKWLLNNYRIIKNADVVHCHDVFFWYFPFRFLFPFKKIFTTFHGYEDYPLKQRDILIRKMSEKLSMGNICIGHFMKKWYKSKPDYISYGGVDEVKNINLKVENNKSAVFVGRLDEQTGVFTYIKAVEMIRKKFPNFDFFMIGDGKFKEKIDKKIKISKSLNNASEYFQKYNFAFVSRYLSIMEAMAAKRLVFAVYDNPLKEDYLRMAPFSKYIIVSNSSSDLISKIFFYLDNSKERDERVKIAYNWVKKYTWEEVTNTYLKLWKV